MCLVQVFTALDISINTGLFILKSIFQIKKNSSNPFRPRKTIAFSVLKVTWKNIFLLHDYDTFVFKLFSTIGKLSTMFFTHLH